MRPFVVYFPELPKPFSSVWAMFADYLHHEVGLPKRWSISQKNSERSLKRCVDDVGEILDGSDLPGFHLGTLGLEKFSISLALGPRGQAGLMHPDTARMKGAMLYCSFENGAKVPPGWHGLIEGICSKWETYGGFEWDQRYNGWQTTIWADDYERIGGAIPPDMRRETVPCPSLIGPDRVRLDISKNPGRKSAVDGQFKAVASKMWLGNAFWEYAPCTKDEVLSADFLIDSRDYATFAFIQSWPEPFTRPDGEQGRIQQKLWRLLFHEDCEWPPGSGGISDKPMYGPPELMPRDEFA